MIINHATKAVDRFTRLLRRHRRNYPPQAIPRPPREPHTAPNRYKADGVTVPVGYLDVQDRPEDAWPFDITLDDAMAAKLEPGRYRLIVKADPTHLRGGQ